MRHEMDHPKIVIGGPAQGISITVWNRPYSGETDYWDKNWLSATADAAAGAI